MICHRQREREKERERERQASAGGQKHSGYVLNVGEKNYIECSHG